MFFYSYRPIPDIVEDLYPHLTSLKSSLKSSVQENIDECRKEEDKSFDAALGEIINILVFFDTGWSKRGNDKNYDSLNGYSTIIGFLSGKILDYATRNRKCYQCDSGHPKTSHDCRLNFVGSAKAMEADAGVQLINHSKILQEAGVKVVIGDEDSSMIAAVRKDNPEIKIHKLADKNHLQKNMSNELYKLSNTHKQLCRKGVIAHIKKCFCYAVSQNKGQSKTLAEALKSIPHHLFGNHENCGKWCTPNSKHNSTLR